ncbi:MAG: FtsX-like permease family protein [Epsilonproteobacteria bacterium]|nr:FtsX-like permease family protein [Campylobacterota bacterium]
MVISLYTLLIAIANSFTGQIKTLMQQESVDIIVQSKFSTTPISSSISEDIVKKIITTDGIKSHVGIVLGKKRLEDRSAIFLFGIGNFSQVAPKLGLTLKEGRLHRSGQQELLMSQRLMKSKKISVGDTITLPEEKPFKVVGSYHSWISFFNSSIITDLNSARTLLHKPNKTNMLFLSLNDPRTTSEFIREINQQYPALMAVKSSDFSSTLGAIKNIFYLSDIIAVITLIIASAILMNTFLIAVNERTKEIGILNAIGWRRDMIVYIFVIESLFLALLGGVLGFFISVGMLAYLKVTYVDILVYLPESLDMSIFVYTMLMSMLIAIISATLPAWYASKILIAKALKDG